jgi:hypothetical protein
VLIELHDPGDNDMGFFTSEYMISYLICWPLLAACSICANHRGSSFVEEYIIPQLFLQWLRDKALSVDGIRYFSMRVNQTYKAERLAINYVFPVRTNEQAGHCRELSKRFRFTLPVPWNLLEDIDFQAPGTFLPKEPYLLNSETAIYYEKTIFGKIETQLNAIVERKSLS